MLSDSDRTKLQKVTSRGKVQRRIRSWCAARASKVSSLLTQREHRLALGRPEGPNEGMPPGSKPPSVSFARPWLSLGTLWKQCCVPATDQRRLSHRICADFSHIALPSFLRPSPVPGCLFPAAPSARGIHRTNSSDFYSYSGINDPRPLAPVALDLTFSPFFRVRAIAVWARFELRIDSHFSNIIAPRRRGADAATRGLPAEFDERWIKKLLLLRFMDKYSPISHNDLQYGVRKSFN